MSGIELKARQKQILEIVKEHQPITSEAIAAELKLTRSALRSDLTILTMSGLLEAKPKVGYCLIDQTDRKRISDFIRGIKVKDAMSLPVVVQETTSVYDAIVQMFLEDVGSIMVIQDGCLSGIVSRKDFLKVTLGGEETKKLPVGMIMTRMPNIITAIPNEPVTDAARKLMEHQIDAMPVVENLIKDGKPCYRIVGRFSKTNITRLFADIGWSEEEKI